jgi:hypothetical protein
MITRFSFLGIFVTAFAQSTALLASVATDSPTNYTTATWTNGANAGTGFTPWSFSDTAPPGVPRDELFNVGVGNFTPEVTWNIGSPTNGAAAASRGFGEMVVGSQFHAKFKIDSVSDLASRVGFRLYKGLDLLYFAQYEDENNWWNFDNTMFWQSTNPLGVTEFIWGRSATTEIDIQLRYNGSTAMGVYGKYWTNGYPDRVEIFSEYQGIETGGLALLEMNAPAVPEPAVSHLIALTLLTLVVSRLRRHTRS